MLSLFLSALVLSLSLRFLLLLLLRHPASMTDAQRAFSRTAYGAR